MRVRAELWGLSLMGVIGLLPSACGGKQSGEESNAAGSGGSSSGGNPATGGTRAMGSGGAIAGSGGAPVGGTSGAGGFATVCESPVFDALSGITTCQNGARYRTQVGSGCNAVPPESTAGQGGSAGEGGAGGGGAGGGGAGEGAAGEGGDDCDPSQCTAGPYGYCSYYEPDSGDCSYACLTDEDCGSGQICSCPEAGFGQCLSADCRTDAECGAGFHCAQTDNSCGPPEFHCEVVSDECRANENCERESNGFCYWADDHRTCSNAVCGRPFLVDEQPRLAPSTNTGAWYEAGQARPCLDQLTAAERRTLADHYTRLGLMEHASIAAFARFALQLLGLGAPAELVSACNRAIHDETAHALSCFSLATSYAGTAIGPGRLELGDCLPAFDLESVLRLVIAEGCVGETVAALEAAEAAERATDPAVKSALQTISIDETRHAELAWRFVRWAIESSAGKLDDVARAVFSEHLLAASEGLPSLRAESERLADHGMLSDAEQLEVRANALRHVVAPCARALLGARPIAQREPMTQRLS